MKLSDRCPICGCSCSVLDVVDFNKSCEEVRGKFLDLCGIPIYYMMCDDCDFCFAPEMRQWQLKDFAEKVYNAEYEQVDPDYADIRPKANARFLMSAIKLEGLSIRHLDYGGGNGTLSSVLREERWNSFSYDPFVDGELSVLSLGKFDFVTAFEVFEHVPDLKQLMVNLTSLLTPDGMVLFSTLLSDNHIRFFERLTWWYASPRNGHISLFSAKSLKLLAAQHDLQYFNISENLHALCKSKPAWAANLLELNSPSAANC